MQVIISSCLELLQQRHENIMVRSQIILCSYAKGRFVNYD